MPPNVQVRDSALDPAMGADGKKVVHYKVAEGREQYKVWLSLAGPRVPFVDQVIYTLHPSFRQPRREVVRTASNPNCTLLLWTWGIFDVTVQLRGKKGELAEFVHTMQYDKDFNDAAVSFIEEAPEKR